MNAPAHRTVSALHFLLVAGCATASAQQRATRPFDAAWRFHLGDVSGAQESTFADAAWRTLDLPHDWSVEGEFSEQNPAGPEGGALPEIGRASCRERV